MGQAKVAVDAVAGGDGDPHAGDVGHTPTALAITANRTLVFSHTAGPTFDAGAKSPRLLRIDWPHRWFRGQDADRYPPTSPSSNESFQTSTVLAPNLAVGYSFAGAWRAEAEYVGFLSSGHQ